MANKYLLELEGVTGSSTLANHEKKITLDSFSHKYTSDSPKDQIGRTELYAVTPNINCSGLVIQKEFEPSVLPVLSALTKGKKFDSAKIYCLNTENEEFLEIHAKDVIVQEITMNYQEHAFAMIVFSYDTISYNAKSGTQTLANFTYSKKLGE